ncbi:MAG TPA: carboxypeptidase regulatory-like domain-containing protein, partial [Candidatus Cybelea sp.]
MPVIRPWSPERVSRATRFFVCFRLAACVCVAAALFSQGSPARAGVTGNITGIVRTTDGAPIAGATVRAIAPSMSRAATSDASGHFVILALSPDTYTLYLSRSGYEDVSVAGVTVIADQTSAVRVTMIRALRTIAHVKSTGATSTVNPGVGMDVYSVNAAQVAAAAPLGGPGNLNNAYSAMAAVPGIQVSQGGIGWSFNAAYVRGQNTYYTGYEYDGVPVNR